MRKATITLVAALAAAVLAAVPGQATEVGGGVYQNGAEGFASMAFPPPGTYLMPYFEYYTGDRFNDGNGDAGLIPGFNVKATALTGRVVHISKLQVLGATYGAHMIVPVVNLKIDAGGSRFEQTGLSDITVSPLLLGWHFPNDLHMVAGVDINVPIGTYDRTNLANFSRHYWGFEPLLGLSWYPKSGFTVDLKLMYDFNLKNTSAQINGFNPNGADYRSGNEFHFDLALGYTIGKWQVGASGYYYKQTTGDRGDDAASQGFINSTNGFKGEVAAAGPSVRYVVGKALVIATYQHEFTATYRPQGERFWIKGIIPLGGPPKR